MALTKKCNKRDSLVTLLAVLPVLSLLVGVRASSLDSCFPASHHLDVRSAHRQRLRNPEQRARRSRPTVNADKRWGN